MKVSVIVPVFNSAKFLRKCLDSLVSQTYKNIEIIVIDDGSTDDSREICDGYYHAYDFIKVYHQANQGVSIARNHGLDVITGEWFCFVDSDDYVEPNYIEAMASLINTSKDYVIKTGFFHETIDSVCIDNKEYSNNGTYICDSSFDISNKYDYSTVWGKLFPTRFVNGEVSELRFNPSIHYGEDYLFSVQMVLLAGGICIYPQKLYHCVFHSGSAVQSFNQKRYTEIEALEEIRKIVINYPRSLCEIEHQLAFRAYTIFALSLKNTSVLTSVQNKNLVDTMKKYKSSIIKRNLSLKIKIAYMMAAYTPLLFRILFIKG